MTIKDSQQSRCVGLIAELGGASGKVRRKLSAVPVKTCGEATVNLLHGCVEFRAKLTFYGVNLAFLGLSLIHI